MILVDTSIWIEHMRRGSEILAGLLRQDCVLSHPFVVGELALGGVKPEVIAYIRKLPPAIVAREDEVLGFIERKSFAGRGIGYVDAHLLAAASLMSGVNVWTFDRKLAALAEHLGLLARVVN